MRTPFDVVVRYVVIVSSLLFIIFSKASAQGYPVTLTVTVIPPYSPYLSDYFSSSGRVLIRLSTLPTQPRLSIRLEGHVVGDNGVSIATSSSYRPALPLILEPGIPISLSGNDLREYFNTGNLSFTGANPEDIARSGMLPEGSYSLCIRALDYNDGTPLSADEPSGCGSFTVADVEPASIVYPIHNAVIPSTSPQNLTFSWTVPIGPPGVLYNYQLQIIELLVPTRSPEEAFRSSRPPYFFERLLTVNSYNYNASNPPLVQGRRYAVRVIASDRAVRIRLRNNGNSEVVAFTWGDTAATGGVSGPRASTGIPAAGMISNVYPSIGDTLPFSAWPFIIRINDLQDNDIELQTEIRLTEGGGQIDRHERTLNWPYGPLESQRRLTFPELTMEHARHIAVYKNSSESPIEPTRGQTFSWDVDASLQNRTGAIRNSSAGPSTVTRGMTKPILRFPLDSAEADTGSIVLQFTSGTAPRNLLPPFPIVQASRAGVTFFNGSIREKWRLEVSRTRAFSRIIESTQGTISPNFDMTSPLLTEDQIRRELYKDLEHRFTLRDTGWYFWRVGWLRNPDGATDSSMYHTSQIWAFHVGRTTIAQVDSVDSTSRDCLSNCTGPTIANRTPISSGVNRGDNITMGLFTITTTEVSWSGNLLSGRGTVRVPFLNAPIKVSFRSLQVNSSRQAFSGEVYAERDNTTLIDSSLAYGVGRLIGLDSSRARSINEYASQAGRLVSGLTGTTPIGMPIGLDNTIDGQRYTIAIMGLKFTPSMATLSAIFCLDFPELNGWLSFGARDICFHPNGLGGLQQATLFQVIDQSIADDANKVRLTFLGEHLPSDSGCYVSWDCEGFKEVRVKGHVSFTREWLVPQNERGTIIDTGRVKATFETKIQRRGNWIARLDFDRFTTPDLNEFGMEVVEAYLDFSDLQNPPGISFPVDYPRERDSHWRGFFLKRLGVSLPKDIHTVGDPTRRIQVAATDIIIDDMGFTGNIRAENILRFTDGTVGGWGFSIDTIGISFAANTFRTGGLSGLIGVPVCDSGLTYNALLRNSDTSGVSFVFNIQPRDTVSASLWAARLLLDRTSAITLSISRDSVNLMADFSGAITIAGDIGSVPGLSMRGIEFQHLRVFTHEPYVDLGHIAFASEQHGMAGFPISLTSFNFVTRSGPRVGLQFGIGIQLQQGSGGISGGTQLSILGRLDTRASQVWAFDGITLDSIGLGGQIGVVTVRGGIRIYDGDATYGDGFKGSVFASFPPGVSVTANVQFGNVRGMEYWYVDGLATLGPSGIPVFSGISIYGFGGGAYHNMRMDTPPPEQSALMAPGDSTRPRPSGIRYIPDAGTAFGLRAAVVIGTSDGGKAFNATVSLEASFSSTGGMGMIALRGDGCMMCDFTDRSAAQVRGRVDIYYDFGRSIFDGRADIWVNVAGGLVQGIGPEGLAGWAHMHSEPDYWFFKIGEPDRRVGIRFASLFETNAYIMVGERLPPPPPPPARVLARLPEYRPVRVGSDIPGDGFAMGAGVYINTGRIPFLIFYARLQLELGFDIALVDYGATTCEGMPPESRIGIDGWYATGQVYGWIHGDIGLFVDVLFFSGEVQILSVSVAAILQAGLPNPTWMKGAVSGSYDVLGGMVTGHCYFEFTVGDICRPPQESPLARQKIITDLTPADGSSNVDVFVNPQGAFAMEAQRPFDLTVTSDDGSTRIRTFRVMVESFTIKKGSALIPSRFEVEPNGFTALLIPREALEPRTRYSARIMVRGEEYISGSWRPALRLDGSRITEERTTEFTTGIAPDSIPQRNVLVSYPRYRQRFYLQDECKNGMIKLRQGQAYLFERPVIQGRQWTFFARLVPFGGGTSFESPITYNRQSATISYSIPSINNQTAYALQIIGKLQEGNTIRIRQELLETVTQVNASQMQKNLTTTLKVKFLQGGGSVNVRENRLIGSTVGKGEKLFYVYHFKTSKFNKLSEKVKTLTNSTSTSSKFLDVVILKPSYIGQELFDYEDIYGGENVAEAPPLIQFLAPFEYKWHKDFANPKVYDLLTFLKRERLTSMNFRRARPDKIGVPPIFTAEVLPTSSIPGRLHDHELTMGTGEKMFTGASVARNLTPSSSSSAMLTNFTATLPSPSLNISYNTDLLVRLDYGQLRDEGGRIVSIYGLIGSEFLSQEAIRRLYELLYGKYVAPFKGEYSVGFVYQTPAQCQDPDSFRRERSEKVFNY